MTTQAQSAIEAQAAALRTIAKSAGYQTDLGARVMLSPYQPEGENPSTAIYRSGVIGMDMGRDFELFRMTVTWSALVVGAPDQLDGMALDAQSDLIRALRGVCGNFQLRRIDIPARDPGSNVLVASVAITTTIEEIAL